MLVIIMTFDKDQCEQSKVNTKNEATLMEYFYSYNRYVKGKDERATAGIAVRSRHRQRGPQRPLLPANSLSCCGHILIALREGLRTWF